MSRLLLNVNHPESPLADVAVGLTRSTWLPDRPAGPVTCAATPVGIVMVGMCVSPGELTPEEAQTPEQEDPCISEETESERSGGAISTS